MLTWFLGISGIYISFLLCFISPPPAFSQAGFTIQNIFASKLGSELRDFMYYHLKRTIYTRTTHSVLILLYCIFSIFNLIKDWDIYFKSFTPLGFYVWLSASILGAIACLQQLYLCFIWSRNIDNHPLAKILSSFRSDWKALAETISEEIENNEIEFTRVGNNNLKITNSWIVQCTAYDIYVAHQRDSTLSVFSSQEIYDYKPGHMLSTSQILTVQVKNSQRSVPPFFIRLYSSDYNQLRTRLQREIENTKAIIIQQPLSEQFLTVLKEVVTENTRRNNIAPRRDNQNQNQDNLDEEDFCIGCMSTPVEIRFEKTCASHNPNDNESPNANRSHSQPVNINTPCGQCYCRPFWCLECLGKWYLSQQGNSRPESWMQGKTRCPTCRAVFCLLDIVYINSPQSAPSNQNHED